MTETIRAFSLSPFLVDASRQSHFLRLIGPRLASQPWLSALWLGGSLARGDADRWSSVDLHLLVGDRQALSLAQSRLCALLDDLLPAGWTHYGRLDLGHTVGLDGFTHARLPAAANQGAVHFRLLWTTADALATHRACFGPARLLWSRDDLPVEQQRLLAASLPTWPPVDPLSVRAGLADFWHFLTHLPAVVNRGEHLAAATLLANARAALIDLVVALNGATRPASPTRINPFLGPAQQDAFEKTLCLPAVHSENWIGQAVALIVLYRWYAPQVVEMYTLDYPTRLEETALALFSVEVPGWPARITTA